MIDFDPFKKIPNRIGVLIENSGKTLKDISEEIGINYETLSAYKRQTRYPKKENAKKLADYFGVSLPYLLGIEQESAFEDPQGNRLKSLRIEKGLTQSEVAKILNTNQSQYGKYENGKTNLSIENAKKLADYFEVSVPYLLGLDDDSTDSIGKIPRKNIFSELARNKGKSLKEISEETGILYPTLSGYNQGIRTPKKENAIKLADYFGVSVAYLLGLENMDSKRDNQIPRPIPFYNDLNLMLSEFKDSQVIESYIDFISKDKKYNPILLKAFKQFIVDEEGYFLTLISESSKKNSPYHYIWEEWNKEKNKKS